MMEMYNKFVILGKTGGGMRSEVCEFEITQHKAYVIPF